MIRCITLFLLFIVPLVPATGGTGSNYTIFGVGDLRLAGSPRSSALGYAGSVLRDGVAINTGSPASWSGIRETTLEASLLHEGFNATDGTKSQSVSLTNFGGAAMAIPISTKFGIVAVGSMRPYSNKDYNVFTTGSQQGMDYVLNHEGSGGLGNAQIGVSFGPFPFIAVGASFNYIFGSLKSSRTLLPASFEFDGGKTTSRTTTNAVNGTFGLMINGTGGLVPLLDPLSVGFTFAPRSFLNANAELLYEFTSEADTAALSVSDILLPLSYGIGASYRVTPRWLVVADYYTQQWGTSNLGVETRDARLFGVGIERSGATTPGASWVDRIALRVGAFRHETYYIVNGEGITEMGLTGGLGVPFSGESRLTFSFEYGDRGSTGNNLIREKILRFTLGITIRELWFLTFDEAI